MTEFMQYAYVYLWGAIALLLFVTGFKQGAAAFVMSLFFAFMTVWYAMRAYGGIAVFEGDLNIIFRCVLAGFLVLFVAVYFISKRKKSKSDDDTSQ